MIPSSKMMIAASTDPATNAAPAPGFRERLLGWLAMAILFPTVLMALYLLAFVFDPLWERLKKRLRRGR